jgi:hypothetical protein
MSRENNRKKVASVLKSIDKKTLNDLLFTNEEGEPIKLGIKRKVVSGNISDDRLFLMILYNKDKYYSINRDTREIETSPNKHRSVLDIWRHFKFYKENATLLDVMALTFKSRTKIRYQICSKLGKRVFDMDRANPYHHDADNRDEFGLIFSEWNDINNMSPEEEDLSEL